MAAYLVLLLAVLSRFLPHAFHATGLNFTAVGGGLLFFGARRSRPEALLAAAAMALTDYLLTVHVYGFAFHAGSYLLTWAWYAAVCLLGWALLHRSRTVLRVGAAVLASSTSFFLISNFAVWVADGLYTHTAAGFGACYAAAIPFYADDLISTAATAGALFGLPALARVLAETLRTSSNNDLHLG